MALLERLFRRPDRGAAPAIYTELVARARAPHWYLEGKVPDSVDGRFDMIAVLTALLLLRLEEDPAGIPASTHVAECFIDDMDAQLREIGIGDVVVGKHVGKMMGMLGGRLGAYREALAAGTLREALARNLWRGSPPEDEAAVAHVEQGLLAWRAALAAQPIDRLVAGHLPG